MRVSINLNEDELARVDAAAASAGMMRGMWVRLMVLVASGDLGVSGLVESLQRAIGTQRGIAVADEIRRESIKAQEVARVPASWRGK